MFLPLSLKAGVATETGWTHTKLSLRRVRHSRWSPSFYRDGHSRHPSKVDASLYNGDSHLAPLSLPIFGHTKGADCSAPVSYLVFDGNSEVFSSHRIHRVYLGKHSLRASLVRVQKDIGHIPHTLDLKPESFRRL